MANAPLFPQRYPGVGRFALLCEGDLVGYEAQILEQWRDRDPSRQDVDVRPSGTGEALLGVADAIGRTVRVVVVEDRDFRSLEQAQKECARKLADREERNVAMRGWLCWSRNEIENYFLDDDVLIPAMNEVFGCTETEVCAARTEAMQVLRLFQAVKAAVASTHEAWEQLLRLRHIGGGKPKWTDTGLNVPEPQAIRAELERKLEGLRKKAIAKSKPLEPFLGDRLLSAYDEKVKSWHADSVPEEVWKRDWAGKELLQLVRQILAASYPAPIESKSMPVEPVDWSRLGKVESAALDRDIERAMQPYLVKHLWRYLETVSEADLNADLSAIAECLVL